MFTLADLAPTALEPFEGDLTSRSSKMTPRGDRVIGAATAARLWVKRDDRVGSLYGGNKVRKLERLLGAAVARGARRVLTVGAAGSHQVVATAVFGARLGLEVEAVLVPQPASARGEANLRLALAHGLEAVAVPAWALAPLAVLTRRSKDVAFVPLGGSNVLGSLGFVSAARELAAQIEAGAAPEPDEIVVAMGSGGTVAGLAAGLEREGLRARVVGVAISSPAVALGVAARRLAFTTARATGLGARASARAAARVIVDGTQVGRGYGHPTTAGARATEIASAVGLELDAVYTAKAFASALARAERGRRVLFWHTLSTVPWPAEVLARSARTELPPHLARLFR